jgi:hypothetical protein
MLNQSELVQRFLYSPESGLFLRRTKAGKLVSAGTINSCGYVRIFIARKAYLAHRLAWLYIHGNFPTHDLDHINCVRHDNRIDNLRDVPRAVNANNRKAANRNSRSGYIGVSAYRNKWIAQFRGGTQRGYLGVFDTAEEAAAAYATAKYQHEGELLCK